MTLVERVEADLLAALKSGNAPVRDTLRLLKSALKNRAIEAGKTELEDNDVTLVIAKEAKSRRESIAAYESAKKPELAEAEKKELKILEAYLPSQLDETAVTKAVQAYLAAHPATAAQTGQVMGALSQELKGQADMGLVAKIVRQELSV